MAAIALSTTKVLLSRKEPAIMGVYWRSTDRSAGVSPVHFTASLSPRVFSARASSPASIALPATVPPARAYAPQRCAARARNVITTNGVAMGTIEGTANLSPAFKTLETQLAIPLKKMNGRSISSRSRVNPSFGAEKPDPRYGRYSGANNPRRPAMSSSTKVLNTTTFEISS